MASPVLLGAVRASGRAQVAVGFTEANQNLHGVVGKHSKPVRWSLKGTKLIAGATPPETEVSRSDPERGRSRPKKTTPHGATPSGSGNFPASRGRCPRLLTPSLSGTRHFRFSERPPVGRPHFCRLKRSISSIRSFTT